MLDKPALERPVLVAAFRGWNDGGQGATLAAGYLARLWEAERFADIDPEGFVDFSSTRPQVSLDEGLTRRIEWPENVFYRARVPEVERDLVLLLGVEPNLRWRTFSEGLAETAESLGVEMVITLGALIADVAHTRPVPITGLASDPDLVERLDLSRSSYEGPTGIVGVLHDACRSQGLTSASLWAAVPHYVATVPNPKAALALLRRLEGLVGVAVEASELEEETGSFERQVSNAVAANPEIEELVQRLEREQAEQLSIGDEIPSGEALARQFERYLRQQGPGPEGGEAG